VFKVYADNQDFTAADANALLQQGVLPFSTRTARDAALGQLDEIPEGLTVWISGEKVEERRVSGAWTVLGAAAQTAQLTADAFPTASASAASATPLLAIALQAGVYRVIGGLKLSAGTCRITSTGSGMSGLWGTGEGANEFNGTGAEAEFGISAGLSPVTGLVTASVAVTWQISGFSAAGGASLSAGSFVNVERIG